MPVGTCKLCLRDRELCDSHFLPKAVYRRFRKGSNRRPVVMTRNLVIASDRQVHDYLLCSECEQRFSVAERYVIPLMAGDGGFPMREKLNGQPALPAGPYLRFAGKQVGLDTNKLAYFAVSMVWRAAV